MAWRRPAYPIGHEKLGGVSDQLARILKQETKFDVRATNLGHIQRGGSPNTYDRWLSTNFGIKAVELVQGGQFGRMAAIIRDEIVDVELRRVIGGIKKVSAEDYERARMLML